MQRYIPKAVNALNDAIDFSMDLEPGKKKVEFFIMSAEHSFDEVFNPDRDPAHFESIVNKLLPPDSLIQQESQIAKAKELLRKKGEELKPHFTFQE